VYVYGGDPPVAVTVTVPFACPQYSGVELVSSNICEFDVTGPDIVFEHPFASVTVTVYVPCIKPVACCVVCCGKVFQVNVYGDVPVVRLTVIVPLFVPQFAGVAVVFPIGNGLTVTCTVAELLHPPVVDSAVTEYVVVLVGDTFIVAPVADVFHV
jgi:hypothetical protein